MSNRFILAFCVDCPSWFKISATSWAPACGAPRHGSSSAEEFELWRPYKCWTNRCKAIVRLCSIRPNRSTKLMTYSPNLMIWLPNPGIWWGKGNHFRDSLIGNASNISEWKNVSDMVTGSSILILEGFQRALLSAEAQPEKQWKRFVDSRKLTRRQSICKMAAHSVS